MFRLEGATFILHNRRCIIFRVDGVAVVEFDVPI